MMKVNKARGLNVILSVILGLVFLVSGITKISALDAFYETLTQLSFVPPNFRGYVLLFLPGIEVTIGYCFWFQIYVREAAVISSSLLVCFTVVTAYQYILNPHGSCGCIHITLLKRLDDPLIAIVRNIVLLILSIVLSKVSRVNMPSNLLSK